MASVGHGSDERFKEFAADLDMILPSSGFADPADEEAAPNTPLDIVEEKRLGLAAAQPSPSRQAFAMPMRPQLRRDGSATIPLQPPPAPPPSTEPPPPPTDSLSLLQLKSLVREVPRVEPTPYAFVYQDAQSLPEEVEEWFAYTTPERANILRAQSCYATEWGLFNDWSLDDDSSQDWTKTPKEKRREFIASLLRGLQEPNIERRLEQLEALVYIVLGCWHETAGLEAHSLTLSEASTLLTKGKTDSRIGTHKKDEDSSDKSQAEVQREKAIAEQYNRSGFQIRWLKNNTRMLLGIPGSLQAIYDAARSSFLRECSPNPSKIENNASDVEFEKRETWCTMTLLYICLEVSRSTEDTAARNQLRSQILSLQPNLLLFLGDIISRIRWDPSIQGELQQNSDRGPSTKFLLLCWKTVLICLGGLDEVDKAKASVDEKQSSDKDGPIITASPLDYHTFRQEISSKYPAYNPPPAYFPLEPDQRTILPPLRVNTTKSPTASMMPKQPAQHGTSIINQPVHIATPAPSPPPSPALGKGGKKQNYQTPHGLPFNYPPLDASSNSIGGKGSTVLQDALVGRKWEGVDIPVSIVQAAELFAERMRATRALKQLWEERLEFLKYERGWTGADEDEHGGPLDPSEESSPEEAAETVVHYDGSSEERLATVEAFYSHVLSNLQSIVMVMMKVILSNVTSLVTQTAGQSGVQSGFHFQDNPNGTTESKPNGAGEVHIDLSTLGQDELDRMRAEEISAKAVTGLLILLLKWFKVSRKDLKRFPRLRSNCIIDILKFEYLTQLLVDANYVPLILKLLQTQDIERVVNYKCESEDWK